jgi:hypothetical protein
MMSVMLAAHVLFWDLEVDLDADAAVAHRVDFGRDSQLAV